MNVKCQICKEKFDRETMNRVEIGKKKKTNKYYCDECYPKFLREKEFKKREREELDSLCETIKEIHGIEKIPTKFFSHIQELRNGSILFGNVKKAFKKGIKYSGIELTYKYCKKDIQYWKDKKDFDDTYGELKYGLIIVINNIDNAKREWKRRKLRSKQHEDQINEKILIDIDKNNFEEISHQNKNNNDGLDISKWL